MMRGAAARERRCIIGATAAVPVLLAAAMSPAVTPHEGRPAAAGDVVAGRTAAWFELATVRGLRADGRLIVVSVSDQRLVVLAAGKTQKQYRISTSKWGVGSRQDSNRTPLGWHRVADWIGGDAVPGQVFVSRRPAATVLPPGAWSEGQTQDYVLTRILHLRGLERGRNLGPGIDSFSRCIYLHGTNQEQLLGQPASHGCIRLSNRDVMELHDLTVGHETYCWIVDKPLAEL